MLSSLIPKPRLHIPTAGPDMQLLRRHNQQQEAAEKVVVVMGATGTGKSRLSVDLATRFSGEIINCDKMQIYKGLDVVTNKITDEESRGIPHHLLSILDHDDDAAHDFTAANFCTLASASIRSILGRGKLPIVAGGSNSFIEALFDDKHSEFRSRYQCSFIWVDVSMPVLHSFLLDRVDRMVQREMIDEIAKLYTPHSDYTKGIRRSIGLLEFDPYLRAVHSLSIPDEETRAILLEKAINETKINTCKLACRQRDKIVRLRTLNGWEIHRIDATEVFKKRAEEANNKTWESLVLVPSSMILGQFLRNESSHVAWDATAVVKSATVASAAAIL